MSKSKKSDNTLLNVATSDFIRHIDETETLSPYALVHAVAQRARQITDEKREEVQNHVPPSEVYKNFHPIADAAKELYTGKINIQT